MVILLCIIAFFIYTLSKGAEILTNEAVSLSLHWGVPKLLIGATIVSIGTTLPEASVSVFAAITGNPGLALGNAVGSIICDTGLILGLATIISPLPLNKKIVNRQGWIQLGSGILLVMACLPYLTLNKTFTEGGSLPQYMGFIFIALLIVYMWLSLRWAKEDKSSIGIDDPLNRGREARVLINFSKLIFSLIIVIISSRILIPAVEETAIRLHVPDSVIAATLVAFGTSLPELIIAITAARMGHGELAVGNIIGADILNVLFVAGSAASVTSGGLSSPPNFFYFLFPAMLFILIIFRIGITVSGDKLKRPFGFILVGVYLLVTSLSFVKGIH